MTSLSFLLLLLRAIIFVFLCKFSTKPPLSSLPSSSNGPESENLTLGAEEEEEEEASSTEGWLSKLPDPILSSIVSFLPVDQAARTSVLARQWESLWRCTSHLFLDQKNMFSSEFQHWVGSARWPPANFRTHIDAYMLMLAEIDNIAGLIEWLLTSHLGRLRSCKILHMIESCRPDHVGRWVNFLLDKGVKQLSLECESNPCWSVYHAPGAAAGWRRRQPPPELDPLVEMFSLLECVELGNYMVRSGWDSFVGSRTLRRVKLKRVWMEEGMVERMMGACVCMENVSVVGCKGFKRLRVRSGSMRLLEVGEMKVHHMDVCGSELKVLVFDNMIMRPKGLAVDAPKLRVFRCYCDPLIRGRTRLGFGRLLLTIKETVIIFRDLLNTIGYRGGNMFENLVTLSFGLDLNNVRELTSLPFILRSCPSLQKLEIHNQATGFVEVRNDCLIPYYDVMFWETREGCECNTWMSEGLKIVVIKGFKGERLEVAFTKYLIAKAAMIESIAIWFNEECAWGAASNAAESFVSAATKSASANLSVSVKPGKKFLEEVGGS